MRKVLRAADEGGDALFSILDEIRTLQLMLYDIPDCYTLLYVLWWVGIEPRFPNSTAHSNGLVEAIVHNSTQAYCRDRFANRARKDVLVDSKTRSRPNQLASCSVIG